MATHLLAAEPGGEPWVVDALLEAAQVALAQGAPEVAARHAQRALAEPPSADARPRVLRALGNAERRLGLPDADQRFVAAIEETADARERAETVLDMLITGAPDTNAIAYTRQALTEVAPVNADLALILRARLLLGLEAALEPMEDELRRAGEDLATASKESLGTRLIAGMLAREGSLRGRPRGIVLPLALRAVGDDDAYSADLAAGYPHIYPLTALAISDEVALAKRRLLQAAEDADAEGPWSEPALHGSCSRTCSCTRASCRQLRHRRKPSRWHSERTKRLSPPARSDYLPMRSWSAESTPPPSMSSSSTA